MKEITKIRVEEGESFMSYDVVSLFTKTAVKEACDIDRKDWKILRHYRRETTCINKVLYYGQHTLDLEGKSPNKSLE